MYIAAIKYGIYNNPDIIEYIEPMFTNDDNRPNVLFIINIIDINFMPQFNEHPNKKSVHKFLGVNINKNL